MTSLYDDDPSLDAAPGEDHAPDEALDDALDDAPDDAGAAATQVRVPHGPRRTVALVALALVAALVVWFAASRGDDQPPPLPPGAVPIDAWAPYWTFTETLPEAEARLADLREVSPFWYGARGVDEIVVDELTPVDDAQRFVDAVRASPARLVPSIRDEMPAGEMAAILADPGSRARHVEALAAFADELDADGLDLDYEQFAFADGRETWEATRPNWVAFVEQLAQRLHDDGRTLTVSIPPVYDEASTGDRGYWVYDPGAIAPFVDSIRIMGYDFSVAEPGPIAPLGWVQSAVDGVSLAVPVEQHHKLVLGVPAYGANWVVSTTGTCPATAEGKTSVTARAVHELAARRSAVPQFDPVTGEWFFAYDLAVEDATTSCVQSRKVHWVDAEGAAARIAIARRAGWGGAALWALGYEDDDVWSTMVTAARMPMAPTVEPTG